MEHGEFDGVPVGQQEVVRTWKRCAWQHRPRGLQFDKKRVIGQWFVKGLWFQIWQWQSVQCVECSAEQFLQAELLLNEHPYVTKDSLYSLYRNALWLMLTYYWHIVDIFDHILEIICWPMLTYYNYWRWPSTNWESSHIRHILQNIARSPKEGAPSKDDAVGEAPECVTAGPMTTSSCLSCESTVLFHAAISTMTIRTIRTAQSMDIFLCCTAGLGLGRA